ncbi:uncharacterized protein E0L32_001619 [Thyridium curvatum]|uniref:ABC transporter n=1 Tax=Thyridium curvatum TaxID=1093900 RepID=A0A507AW06_9PEZI|nr:uncharacterized protein E0L32_001578 [Thyridium curvatum]XP_030990870.1 uncharacterized protein E0L32_001619 [Thyridium curvatum]TPX09118.1 hypothetical protein E0L32_001578 [Thyridium curvatum]TPX09159.1 hypothetical protein E0L32_001619 [Thyridium curvatum]
METSDGKAFPRRKWYRRVPFLSQRPIETKLTERHVKPKSTSTSNAESGQGTDTQTYETETPETTANLLSIITFNWLGTLLRTGYSRPLQADDLYDLPNTSLTIDHADRLEKSWAARLKANRERPPPPKGWLSWRPFWERRTTDATVLTLSLNDVCFRRFWTGGFLKMLGDLTQIVSPLLIRFVINSLSDPSEQAYRSGFGLAVGLFLVLAFSIITNVHGFYRSASTGILLRAALMHVLYRRATTQLTEQAKLKGSYATGKLMSLMSADITRIDFCCGFFHSAWTSLLQIILCLGLTIWTLGYSALPGFGLLALLYPLQSFMMKTLFRLRRNSMPFTDARIKAVTEAVSTIRLAKTNAYEQSMLSKIGKLRNDEVIYIRKRMLLRALNIAVSFTAPTLASVVSILCYGATSGNMDPGKIFSSLAFFLLMRTPMGSLPIAISAIADARAALERLAGFMVVSDEAVARDAARREELGRRGREAGGDAVVEVKDAMFTYHDDPQSSDSDDFTNEKANAAPSANLYINSLKAKKGQVVCIVGPVASGKSSVFRALLGDMHLASATLCSINLDLSVPSQLAFAPQAAWLLSETVRENIVFGRPFEPDWYDEVLHRCCLHPDLAMLSDGDMTVVGEKGVSLSGGQKQRIALARAVYGRSQLMLLDDSFSALDAQVGAHVFENVVNQARRKSEGTIILVTHSMVFARQADHVVYMEKGRIVEQGTFDQLERGGGRFSEYIMSSKSEESSSATSIATTPTAEADDKSELRLPDERVAKTNVEENKQDKDEPSALAGKQPTAQKERGKEIMQREERLIGTVSGKTYLRYLKFGNAWITVPLFFAAIAVFQGSSVVSPLWLSWWQTGKYAMTEGVYMGGFAAWGIGQSLGLFMTSVVFALFCFWCSNHLHAAALSGILFAPIAFFDTTPQGRITHRFSKDMDAVDNVVGEQLRIFISTTVQVIGTIIVVSIVLPVFLAIAAGVLLLYIWTGMYYRPAARELRRLNNLLRSRIYEHFNESLSGLPTLKAFGVVGQFVDDNARKIDTENKAYWLSIACVRWLNFRLDLYGAVLVLGTGLLVVGLRDTIDPASGGVVLSYMVTAQAAFGNMIRFSAEIENNMNSVERLLYYAYNIPQEPPHDVRNNKPLKEKNWPSKGHIKFENLTLSYRPELDPALKDVTLDIRPGERIGVIGRTGAGKSTLITALLRLTEPSKGRIVIDDVDIHTVGLHLLRSNMSVISQDAVLLAGTIRYNLDPFQQYDDEWLVHCLRMVGLGGDDNKASTEEADSDPEKDTGHRGSVLHLDSEVKENGSNISHGQRSLISIARALVKRSKIVILDEATASIDGRADKEIHAMLQEVTGDATVLTVAHRLDTVVDSCDRVLVMEKGTVAEFDTVSSLYAKPNGLFRALCDAAKITLSS